jgi:hypothetical protein
MPPYFNTVALCDQMCFEIPVSDIAISTRKLHIWDFNYRYHFKNQKNVLCKFRDILYSLHRIMVWKACNRKACFLQEKETIEWFGFERSLLQNCYIGVPVHVNNVFLLIYFQLPLMEWPSVTV